MKSVLSISVAILILLNACQSNQSSKPIAQDVSSGHKVIVAEVIQVSEYTYLKVTENRTERWLATPPIKAEKGETYYYEGGFEMTNFKSKELDKTFESIIFLEGISSTPIGAGHTEAMVSPGSATPKEGKKEIIVTPAAGAVTIAELYSKKANYSGKVVKVTAEVTKFSPEIMNINWIHLQDGTESDGKFDLTVTSPEIVKVGDVITIEGKITLDKDLGYGYFYEVLLEDAKIVK
jgi:hypothetical protein